MFKCFLFRRYEMEYANYLKTVSCQVTMNDTYEGLTHWPLLRVIPGHMLSNAVLPLTFDRIEIELWGLAQCVCLAKPYQPICNMTCQGHHVMICNMTCQGHHVTSFDLEVGSNFDFDFSKSPCIMHMFGIMSGHYRWPIPRFDPMTSL